MQSRCFKRMYEKAIAFLTSVQEFFVSNSQSEPFVFRAKASPAKRSGKGYGDDNAPFYGSGNNLRSFPRNRTEHRFSTKLCLLVDYLKGT